MMRQNEKSLEIDMNQILARANQNLRYESQVMPDDPVLTLLALNKALFQVYLESMQVAIRESHSTINEAIGQELKAVKATTARMIENTGGHLQSQLENIGLHWEMKFREAAAQETAKFQQITHIVYWGAIFWFVAGFSASCIILARYFIG